MNIIAELERCGIPFEPLGGDELGLRCPFHDDKKSSLSLNQEKRVFQCHAAGCGASGDFLTLLAGFLKTTRSVVYEELNERYGWDPEKTVDASVVEKFHSDIGKAGSLLVELTKRGITKEAIDKYRIGFGKGRITIPILNKEGQYVNIRRYLPGAPQAEKMKNLPGRGKERLFPLEQLKYKNIVLCGGELKAIAVAERMNSLDIGAISTTSGEGNWSSEFSKEFAGKSVFVCFDIDEGGKKAVESVCPHLFRSAEWVGVVDLPLDPKKYPAGDVNDFFGREGKTAKDFLKLLQEAKPWAPPVEAEQLSEEPTDVGLDQAMSGSFTARRIRLNAVVSAMDTTPFSIPKEVHPKCDRSQPHCSICPVFFKDGPLKVPEESIEILEMMEAPIKVQRDALRRAVRIPECKVVTFTPKEFFNVESIRISPRLEIANGAGDRVLQPAVFVGSGLEANAGYEFVGKSYPHPRTQQSVVLLSKGRLLEDTLTSFDPGRMEDFAVFRPNTWSAADVASKVDDIYSDLSMNITRIYKRTDLHLMVDLAFHSVLLIDFLGSTQKGWVEILIAGDSSQGKSETTMKLMEHYHLGERFDCKNATVAGLLGGLQQFGSRWFVTWGVIPNHDRRLVVLEEAKGASVEVISHLTDMRSSGIAEIPKIERRRTFARTRLIMLSNPRSSLPTATYNYGVEMLRELIGAPEDLRRFDACLITAASEVSADDLNHRASTVPHVYTSELCRRLILTAWTRLPSQVDIQCEKEILRQSQRLCGIFDETIPIVDRGSMRFKLLRLSTALAARLGSYDGNVLTVHPGIAEYVGDFLHRVYSSSCFGYADFSATIRRSTELGDPKEIEQRIRALPFAKDFVEQMLLTNDIELRDISDWCGWIREDAIELLSFFVRKHALIRSRYSYRKTSEFIRLLKGINEFRPQYIPEEKF